MKKKLQVLLREQAYQQVKKNLNEQNISINDVTDEDLETLVADKEKGIQDSIKNSIKGFTVGSIFSTALSLLSGT